MADYWIEDRRSWAEGKVDEDENETPWVIKRSMDGRDSKEVAKLHSEKMAQLVMGILAFTDYE